MKIFYGKMSNSQLTVDNSNHRILYVFPQYLKLYAVDDIISGYVVQNNSYRTEIGVQPDLLSEGEELARV